MPSLHIFSELDFKRIGTDLSREPSEYQALIAALITTLRPIPRVSRDFPMARLASKHRMTKSLERVILRTWPAAIVPPAREQTDYQW